ncbi:hypothetical protein BV22DRAFT_1130267 [Leucogyrophana mollusca]|uniref:Uncharacterized protein n=1 Tax=Leucogyrophana mollusca TaxID=85980 RepID=A0ACB8BDX0_9AGAM|nr:hypothetical protein BV22DRAFT_1130267 [Leucogyrophana mollusca]
MAKPEHGQAESSYTSSTFPQRPQQRTTRTKTHRRHSHARSSALSVCPSSSLLSILATIVAASPAVDGSPLPVQTAPPTFLCPLIARDNAGIPSETPVTIPLHVENQQIALPSPTYTPKLKKRRQIADKYVQGNDSRWRKTDAWTLYGSSCCSSTPSTGINDEQAGPTPPASASSSTFYPSSTSTEGSILEDTSVLPAGWPTGSANSSKTESTIILALAIVLAVSICSFMVGCIFWRRKKKRVRVEHDIELKVRQKIRPDDASEDGEREKEARGKLKIWSKATARWKANVRHSARRRRSRRHVFSASKTSRSRSPSLSDLREVSSFSALSPPSSPRPSFASPPDCANPPQSASPLPEREGVLTPVSEDHVPSSTSISPRSSPPAYNPSTIDKRPDTRLRQQTLGTSDHDSTHSSSALVFERCDLPLPEDDHIPYTPSFAAHVATDDKAQLARLEDMASAPPAITADGVGSSTQMMVSAPEWHDEPDDFGDSLPLHASLHLPPLSPAQDSMPPSFPSLPSKADIPSGRFDSLSYSYDDDFVGLEPESEPSAPPFEAHPSEPPSEEYFLEPSAPPMEEDTSSESWHYTEDESSIAFDEESSSHLSRRPSSGRLSPSILTSPPPVQGPVARDGTLPQYHP